MAFLTYLPARMGLKMKDTKTIIVWSGIIFLLFVFIVTAVVVAVHYGETWAIVLCTAVAVTALIMVGVAISNIAVWSNWAQDKQLMTAQARLMNDDVMANARAMAELQKSVLASQRIFTENGRLEKLLQSGSQPEPQFFQIDNSIYHGLEE